MMKLPRESVLEILFIIRSKPFAIPAAFQNAEDWDFQNSNFASCFVWLRYIASYYEERILTKSV
jgi:hypothetical protein